MNKPLVIVHSADTDDVCSWSSGGWYGVKQRGTIEAEALYLAVHEAIQAANTIPEAIANLRTVGFEVEQRPMTEEEREFAKLPKEVVRAGVEAFDELFEGQKEN